MCQRTSHRMNPFILAKAFWFPKDFSRKALWSGFGATPQHLTPPTARRVPCGFLHLSFGERCAKELPTEMYPFIFAKVFADFQGDFYKKPLEAGFGATPQHSTRHNLRGVCRDIQCSHCRKALREAVFQTVMTQKCSQRRGRAILPFLYKNEK